MPAVQVHAGCGKLIAPLAAGETQWFVGESKLCSICQAPIFGEDTCVYRNDLDIKRYLNGTFKGNPELPKAPSWNDLLTDEAALKALLRQLTKEMAPVLGDMVSKLAEGKIQELAKDALRAAGQPVAIQIADLPEIPAAQRHKSFTLLLRALVAGVNPWLAGPSGSGKTTAAMQAAEALKVPFRYTGAVSDAYGLLGFRDATGNVVCTPFRDAWENGGVFLWDEIDGSDPNALLSFNAALANGSCAFPDATIPKHPGCLLIAAANTWGHGATNEYVGRNKIDAAFLKRFAFIAWDYDEDLERNTCSNKEWCARVQEVRKRVLDSKIRVLVTPRETYIGEKLLAAGCSWEETESMTIRSGMTDEQWSKCKPLPRPGQTGSRNIPDIEVKIAGVHLSRGTDWSFLSGA